MIENERELLKYSIENGIIDPSSLQAEIVMLKRSELLNKHPYEMWKGKDGRRRTYLPNGDKRQQIKRNHKQDLEDAIIDYWQEQMENPTLEDAFKAYNDRRLEVDQISNASHTRYQQDFQEVFSEKESVK